MIEKGYVFGISKKIIYRMRSIIVETASLSLSIDLIWIYRDDF